MLHKLLAENLSLRFSQNLLRNPHIFSKVYPIQPRIMGTSWNIIIEHVVSLCSEMNTVYYGISLRAVALLLQELQVIKVAQFWGNCVALVVYGPKTAVARNVLTHIQHLSAISSHTPVILHRFASFRCHRLLLLARNAVNGCKHCHVLNTCSWCYVHWWCS